MDGFLTAREVFDLDLRAEMVVLSACNTGLGAITGDGVNGLARAFLHAGASSVVVSLWRVADAAGRDVMVRFYGALGNGRDRARALRQAQVETLIALRGGQIRAEDGTSLAESPLYWAPFVMVGEPR